MPMLTPRRSLDITAVAVPRLDTSAGPQRGGFMSYIVSVGFDEANHRYYVLSSDIPGLQVETETFEDFVDTVRDVTPELVGDQAAGTKIRFEREIELAV
jgi:hypothetical protein